MPFLFQKNSIKTFNLKIFNDTQATILAINKHLFQDLGISQKYSHLKISKYILGSGKIIFDLPNVWA